jgi:neutral ceramidase
VSEGLKAGAARSIINPKLGTMKIGGRLFGEPIQAIESDLTATALVLAGRGTKVVIVALDLCTVSSFIADELRAEIAPRLDISSSNVLINESHAHSAPALPGYYPDDYGAMFRDDYYASLRGRVLSAVVAADRNLVPARLRTGWGASAVGVYRRERRGGRDVLGEVPDHPIDDSVGVIRIDDLDGGPIATLFRYSAHPVTVGGRSLVASADFPGPARTVLERHLGGLGIFLQGCGGNINPRGGIGYEIDCRDAKNRLGLELGGEVLKVAAGIRTNRRAGERRPLGTVPNILFTPWEPVDGQTCTFLGAVDDTIALEYGELPSPRKARAIRDEHEATYVRLLDGGAPDWEVRVAAKRKRWSQDLVAAVERGHAQFELKISVVRVNEVVIAGMNVETFFETGQIIRQQAPTSDTFVLGYTNGSMAYLPRADDYPSDGWRLDGDYALPDMLPQFYPFQVVALRPDAEERARRRTTELIEQIAGELRRRPLS